MRHLISAILITLLAAPLCHARPIAPLEGLEALRKAFSGITDFTAEITQEKRISLMKRSMVMTGQVRFRKPDQFFMEINPPYAGRMLLRDAIIEQEMSAGSGRNRIVLPPEQGLKRWFDKLALPVASLPEGVVVLADRNGSVYTLTIAPKGTGMVKELIVTFLENGIIRRLVINERNGDRATMTFKNVKRNTGLTNRDFRLE